MPLADGEYDAIVIDVDDGDDDGTIRVELTILAGPHKGEVVAVRAPASLAAGDALDLLGQPGTLTVRESHPSLRLDP